MESISDISNVRHLTWDSEFFGVQTVQVLPRKMTGRLLTEILQGLWSAGVGLVYWAADPSDPESSNAASICNALLVDTRRVYGMSVDKMISNGPPTHDIREYDALLDWDPDLEDIAVDCGKFSRFQIDPRIPDETCSELYRTWIWNSVNTPFADGVLVSRNREKLSGLVTVRVASGQGSIGLLGVSEAYRGQGIGRSLIREAGRWFSIHGCSKGLVTTQDRNHAACVLYESCGFSLERTDHYYHFWNPNYDSV